MSQIHFITKATDPETKREFDCRVESGWDPPLNEFFLRLSEVGSDVVVFDSISGVAEKYHKTLDEMKLEYVKGDPDFKSIDFHSVETPLFIYGIMEYFYITPPQSGAAREAAETFGDAPVEYREFLEEQSGNYLIRFDPVTDKWCVEA